MDIVIIVSLIFAFGALITGFVLEGGAPNALLQLSAAIIVFGGTFGAIGVSFPLRIIAKLPKSLGIAFKKREVDLEEKINYFKRISIKTRQEGLLVLESELKEEDVDPFIRRGLQMVVDGVDLADVRSILDTKLEQTSERHEEGIEIFTAAGGFAPTMGIIGTVMGLVLVVANLSDPTELGPKIASAFMATLYGIASANLFWLPVANKLKVLDKEEINEKLMYIEAICLIQQGANPNTIVSKLQSFLSEKEAAKFDVDL
jgi:chemotaxis protein MotA